MRAIPAAILLMLLSAAPVTPPRDYSIHAVPMTAVTIDDGFWAPKLEVNRTVTIPHILKENDDTGRVANFEKAAGRKTGAYEGRRFNDTDIYKIIEAASYSLARGAMRSRVSRSARSTTARWIAFIARTRERPACPRSRAAGTGRTP